MTTTSDDPITELVALMMHKRRIPPWQAAATLATMQGVSLAGSKIDPGYWRGMVEAVSDLGAWARADAHRRERRRTGPHHARKAWWQS